MVTSASTASLIETSVIQPLDDLFKQAIQQGTSDIHFESGEAHFRVRFRIDGRLHIASMPPWQLRDAMVSRLKVLARMDIAEKRVPQDGRIQYRHGTDTLDLRVSSLPTLHGEKIVVRILNFSRERPSLAALGYEPDDQTHLAHAIAQPHGMVLMTGPTGSGKTASLYSCLDLLNRSDINISTVEDPSEIHLPGANQVNVNERAGLTFAVILRALLRQDPDVIMVGEIRDTETAEIAIQAAQTGHLVLSTLHTNDAPSTLARLRHMGIAPFNVAASVLLITAQRLVRRLCPHCKRALSPKECDTFLSALTQADQRIFRPADHALSMIYQAVGCDACDQGYKGRIGIYQIMPVSDALQTLILRDSDAQTLTQQATREGMRTLRQAGWLKVAQGITSVEEIMALTAHA
jgi:type IV pilus assembly protein PilB